MEKPKVNTNQRLINALLLHSSFIDNLGLLNGKMGISIFFYHLARKTGNSLYEDFAGELIDEIYDEISLSTSLDFANGLAGIGWGIEYLVQNHFIEADTCEVLEDFDKRLLSMISGILPSIGICEGAIGYGAYLLKRLQSSSFNEKVQTSNFKQHLIYLISELDRLTLNISDIIREPLPRQPRERILQPKNLGKESTFEERTFAFDLTWDYPVLLIFLADVFKLHLCREKVAGILNRLITPLLKAENHPQLHSNRLLLVLALAKLNQIKINPLLHRRLYKRESNDGFDGHTNLGKIISSLLSGVNRAMIAKELSPDCAFFRNGTMGIAWIYRELFKLSDNLQSKTEADYWINESFKLKETDQGYAGFYVTRKNEEQAFDILNGLTGISFNLIN